MIIPPEEVKVTPKISLSPSKVIPTSKVNSTTTPTLLTTIVPTITVGALDTSSTDNIIDDNQNDQPKTDNTENTKEKKDDNVIAIVLVGIGSVILLSGGGFGAYKLYGKYRVKSAIAEVPATIVDN